MDCVNHSGVTATAFCQNCGKALCPNCVRNGAGGQILCEPCWVAWQNVPNPFAAPPVGAPNPAAAAVLGLIPGVGAMYNGQFFKGLIHVVIFAVLINITEHYGIFGIFIGAWVLYQSFEAFHTAKARRDGQPVPDPLGLNEGDRRIRVRIRVRWVERINRLMRGSTSLPIRLRTRLRTRRPIRRLPGLPIRASRRFLPFRPSPGGARSRSAPSS